MLGQAFSPVAGALLKMFVTHIRLPGFSCCSRLLLPAVAVWEAVVMTQDAELLPSTWEIWMNFSVPASDLQALCLESEPTDWASPSFCHFVSNK